MSRCVETCPLGMAKGEQCIHHAGHQLIDHEAWSRDGSVHTRWRTVREAMRGAAKAEEAVAARALDVPGGLGAIVAADAGPKS